MVPSKYQTYVYPYLDRISEWSSVGVSEKRIAEKLGVAYQTLITYKGRYPELLDALKKGRQDLVDEAYTNLAKLMRGFEYEESDTYIKPEGGSYTVKRKRYEKPNPAAISMVLKNWAADEWSDNPAVLAIRKEELALKQRLADAGEWVGV
jgi:hypothetical protein